MSDRIERERILLTKIVERDRRIATMTKALEEIVSQITNLISLKERPHVVIMESWKNILQELTNK